MRSATFEEEIKYPSRYLHVKSYIYLISYVSHRDICSLPSRPLFENQCHFDRIFSLFFVSSNNKIDFVQSYLVLW